MLFQRVAWLVPFQIRILFAHVSPTSTDQPTAFLFSMPECFVGRRSEAVVGWDGRLVGDTDNVGIIGGGGKSRSAASPLDKT
jgi:hypothetical protein